MKFVSRLAFARHVLMWEQYVDLNTILRGELYRGHCVVFTELQDKHIDHSCSQTQEIFILILPNGNLLRTSIVMFIFQNLRLILQLTHLQNNTT